MKEQFKDYPICVNCKYYLEEKTGPLQTAGTCGLTMINPVTGNFEERRSKVKLAAAFRKDNMPCGPGGLFFQPGKKKAEPKKKHVEVKEEVEPEVEAVFVNVSDVAKIIKDDVIEGLKEEAKEGELLPLEPGKKRRRRAK